MFSDEKESFKIPNMWAIYPNNPFQEMSLDFQKVACKVLKDCICDGSCTQNIHKTALALAEQLETS